MNVEYCVFHRLVRVPHGDSDGAGICQPLTNLKSMLDCFVVVMYTTKRGENKLYAYFLERLFFINIYFFQGGFFC